MSINSKSPVYEKYVLPDTTISWDTLLPKLIIIVKLVMVGYFMSRLTTGKVLNTIMPFQLINFV